MTVEAPTLDAEADAPPPPAPRVSLAGPIALRWVLIVAATTVAFGRAAEVLARQARAGDPIWYLADLPVFAIVMALGIQRRRGPELPIHDRQTDGIVAFGLGVFIALGVCVLQPRIALIAAFSRLEIPEAILFVFVTVILCFGTRPAFRFWPAWSVLLLASPVVFRFGTTRLGGTPLVIGLAGVGYGALSAAVATGWRPWQRLIVAVGIALVVGGIATKALESHGGFELGAVPGALAALTGGTAAALLRRFRPRLTDRHVRRKLALGRVSPATLVVVAAAGIALALAPVRASSFSSAAIPSVTPGATSLTLVPTGWRLLNVQSWTWPTAYFGAGASFVRYLLQPPAGSGYQESAIDVTTGPSIAPFAVYPTIDEYDYDTPVEELTNPLKIAPGLKATVDYTDPLQVSSDSTGIWAIESFLWKPVGGEYQRIAVSSLQQAPSNGQTDELPVPAAPFKTGNFKSVVSDLLRGRHPPEGSAPPRTALAAVQALTTAFLAAQHLNEASA